MSMSSSKARQLGLRLAITMLCAGGSAICTSRALGATATATSASEASATDAGALDEVIVTGSRETGLKASDSPAPIQIVSADALNQSGAPDLMSALSQLVPSLQMQAFGFDMAGQTLTARLRGVSPNDVLVMVNGKRRHTTSNLAVDVGSPFQGAAGVDLNFIPLDAIDHIEVLTEGAAAQYGTDAIAGVVNIILKRNSSGGTLSGTYGQYGNNGGGRTEDVSGNAGFEAGTGGFFNITGNFRNHGHSNVGEIDPRLLPANLTSYPDTNAANVPGYPYTNRISGDAAVQQKILSVNSGFDFDGGTELYLFGTYGHKNAASYENYRMPSKIQYTPAGGTVRIRLWADPAHAHVVVSDTGVGMSAEERARAFDMSYRGRGAQALRAGGRGLGLTLSRELVEAMGGSISLWSEEDRGSEVRVLLPVASEMAT